MKKLLLLLCFVFIHQVVYPVYFKHLGMSDGLSQVSVMSIYQDVIVSAMLPLPFMGE